MGRGELDQDSYITDRKVAKSSWFVANTELEGVHLPVGYYMADNKLQAKEGLCNKESEIHRNIFFVSTQAIWRGAGRRCRFRFSTKDSGHRHVQRPRA